MKDEWIEQPASEINEFQVGDMIRVYGVDKSPIEVMVSHVGIVECGQEDLVGFRMVGHKMVAHFKACRLLKKREPRVLWLPPGFFNGWDLCKTIAREPREGWIKVREVFDGEE